MKSNIFIPKRIKVGFNPRSDTYTGMLGYVIYNDGKVWRKETSWNSWKSPKVTPVEYDNTPLEGFVLNKKVGGYKSDWNFRQAYCRVYDPRGFEFEITIPNLLYILENANSIKGKGLEGKFIYGWDGKDLVLLPEDTPEYKEMVSFTETLGLKVSKKELIPGGMYTTSTGTTVTYLTEAKEYSYKGATDNVKKLWFYQHESNYIHTMNLTVIKKYVGDNVDYVNLLDLLDKNTEYKPKVAKVYKYELYTDFAFKSNNYYSNSQEEVFIPASGKDKFKRVWIAESSYQRNDVYFLRGGRRGDASTEHFSTVKELIAKHPIYKQIQVNEEIK